MPITPSVVDAYTAPDAPKHDTPDTFATQLLAAQRDQHNERMIEARELRSALTGRLEKVETGIQGVRLDLAAKPGKWEFRAIIGAAVAVFVVMLISFLASRGVDTHQAVQDTRILIGAPATPEPAPVVPEG